MNCKCYKCDYNSLGKCTRQKASLDAYGRCDYEWYKGYRLSELLTSSSAYGFPYVYVEKDPKTNKLYYSTELNEQERKIAQKFIELKLEDL